MEADYGPAGYLFERARRFFGVRSRSRRRVNGGFEFSARVRSIQPGAARHSSFTFTPPGGYQFQSNDVDVPLGSARRFLRRRSAPRRRRRTSMDQSLARRPDLERNAERLASIRHGSRHAACRCARMRVQLVVNREFVTALTDGDGLVRWNRSPRPVFALAQWGDSYAFLSLLPQPPLPATIVGVRTDSAVVHAGESVRVAGFARTRSRGVLRAERRNRDRFAARRSGDDRRAARAARCGGRLRDDVRGCRPMRRRANTACLRRPPAASAEQARRGRQRRRALARCGRSVRRRLRLAPRRSAASSTHRAAERRCELPSCVRLTSTSAMSAETLPWATTRWLERHRAN